MMKRKSLAVAIAGAITGISHGNWSAAPLDVHEWGVNTFDWNTGNPLVQELPDYLYTDKKPGEAFPSPDQRVRDLPPDSGIRTKPILYFYPSKRNDRGSSEALVGVEMRFAFGFANAWWPQVNRYRTDEISRDADGPDWDAWLEKALEAQKQLFLNNNEDGKGKERWETELEIYQKLSLKDKIQRLTSRQFRRKPIEFPEDRRMQLVWEKLTLHQEVPDGLALPGEDLEDDHWAKIAREVDAAYVSNGKETERYVFYEGETREEPAIALLPAEGGARHRAFSPGDNPKRKEVSLVNVGKHPIYDVFAVYRDQKKGILWLGYLPMMQSREVALRIPDFEQPREHDDLKISPEEFRRRTTGRMIENLTAGSPVSSQDSFVRDPADSQGPTKRHQLFMKEAVGLEKIWHDEFFQAEGLTVIYRESPEYLDEAMPLNIFTSMYWFIRLSRCGLVLNRNLPLREVHENESALWNYQIADWNEGREESRKLAITQMKRNRLLSLGQAKFYLPSKDGEEPKQLKEIRAAIK